MSYLQKNLQLEFSHSGNQNVSVMRYELERNLALLTPIITENLGLFCLSLTKAEGIHPECKIFQQVMREEALCLEKNESVSPDLKGNGPYCQAVI